MKRKYKRKQEVSFEQLQHMGSRRSVKSRKEKFIKLPDCITRCSEVPTFFIKKKKGKQNFDSDDL